MKKPAISLVIPALNEEKYLGKTLESLQNQDYKNFEVIVVDNSSTDKTAKIAKNFGAKVVFEPKKRVAFARQTGFAKAKGEIIATTDADTILPSNRLSKIQKKFRQNPGAVAVTGFFDFYDSGILARLLFLIFSRFFFLLTNSYPGVNIAIKKKAFEKIGGFNLECLVGEDADICRRLKKNGQVVRDQTSLVKTSARRYKKGGVISAWGNYLYLSLYRQIKIKPTPIFKSGADLEENKFSKTFDYLLALTLLFLILRTALKINPAITQVIRSEKALIYQNFQSYVPKK